MRPFFSVVIGTLLRPTYYDFLASLRRQTFRDFEVIARCEPKVSLPVSQNRAAATAQGQYLAFRDDDVILPPDHLQRLAEVISQHPDAVGVNGPVIMGDGVGRRRPWGFPWSGMGANLTVRADAFRSVDGFVTHEDLGELAHGWRQDIWLWWALDERFPGRTVYDERVVVNHPSATGGWFVPLVEDRFFQRWRGRYMKYLIPMDPVSQRFVLETQDLTAEERTAAIAARIELRKSMRGIPYIVEERTMKARGARPYDFLMASLPADQRWMSIQELDYLYDTMSRLAAGGGRSLNIGCFKGLSCAALAAAAPTVCIDTFEGSLTSVPGPKDFDWPAIRRKWEENMGRLRLRARIELFVMRSEEALPLLYKRGDRFRLVFVDGSHAYEDVLCDITRSWELLEPGGALVIDDFRSDHPGVTRAAEEFGGFEQIPGTKMGVQWK